MNYDIEYKVNGINSDGLSESITIDDYIRVKIDSCEMDYYINGSEVEFFDCIIYGKVIEVMEAFDHDDTITLELEDMTGVEIWFRDIEWFEKCLTYRK